MQILSQPREAVLLVCLCSAGTAPRALRMGGRCSLTGWDFWPLFYLPYIYLWCVCMHLCVHLCVRSPVTSVYLISVATPACGPKLVWHVLYPQSLLPQFLLLFSALETCLTLKLCWPGIPGPLVSASQTLELQVWVTIPCQECVF